MNSATTRSPDLKESEKFWCESGPQPGTLARCMIQRFSPLPSAPFPGAEIGSPLSGCLLRQRSENSLVWIMEL